MVPRSWLAARDLMKKARFKDEGKPIAVETRLVISRKSPTGKWDSDDCVYAVRYHSTEVVRFYPNGDIGVDLNDWDTKTTKQRIRDCTDASIWSRKGESMLAAWTGGSMLVIPMDISKEYILQPDAKVRLPNGIVVDRSAVRCPPSRSASKTRDRVKNPVAGEVLISPEGKHYIVFNPSRSRYGLEPSTAKVIKRYLGDFDFNRDYVFVDDETIEITELFALTMSDWTSGSRFVRSFDN